MILFNKETFYCTMFFFRVLPLHWSAHSFFLSRSGRQS